MVSLPKQRLSPKTERHAHAFAFSTFPNKDPITPKVLAEGVLGAWGKGGGTLPPRQNYRSCAAIQLMASRRSSVPS